MSSSELEYFPQDDDYDYEQHFAPADADISYKYIAPITTDAGGKAVSKEMYRVRKGEIEKPLAMMSDEERALLEELDADFDADIEGECDEDFESMIETIIPRAKAGSELAKDIHWGQHDKEDPFLNLNGNFDHVQSRTDHTSMEGSCSSDGERFSLEEGGDFDEVMAAYDSDSQRSSCDPEAGCMNNDIKELNELAGNTMLRETMVDPGQVRLDGETKQKILAQLMQPDSSTESEGENAIEDSDGPPIHHRLAKSLGSLPKAVLLNRSIKENNKLKSNRISSDMFDFKI